MGSTQASPVRRAVVIGGTHGMGRATVDALLAGGAEVLLTGNNPKHIEAARAELGSRAHVVRSDATRLADIASLAQAVEDELGPIDLLFFNAGFAVLEPLEAVTEETYDQTFAVNTRGAYFTVQRLARLIRNGGAIVFTTSIANEAGYPTMSVYAGAKAAVRAFVRVFAVELAPRNIRVNAVSPGFITTPSMGLSRASQEEIDAFVKEGERLTPMGRMGTSDEVARAALFLAFEATFTTGAELLVDGGLAQV